MLWRVARIEMDSWNSCTSSTVSFTAESYRNLLVRYDIQRLRLLLQDYIFQQDGAFPNITIRVMNCFNTKRRNNGVRSIAPVFWTTHSPDLTPSHCCICDNLKPKVYSTLVDSTEAPRRRTVAEVRKTREKILKLEQGNTEVHLNVFGKAKKDHIFSLFS